MLMGWPPHTVEPGDAVLVWGGAGGLGSIALQITKAAGGRAVAVISDEAIEQHAGAAAETNTELSLDMQQMLEILDEEDRAMVILKYAESYSYEELSEIFGHSISACKMRISRARKKLQDRFGE
jgi:RNA polymerase sigma factor (sigma-70 family)